MKISIKNKDAYWLDFDNGLKLKVKPYSSFFYTYAHWYAGIEAEKLKNKYKEDNVDSDLHQNQIELAALYQSLFISAVAEKAVIGWSGVVDEKNSEDLKFSSKTLRIVFDQYPKVMHDFHDKYIAKANDFLEEKKN